MARTGEGIDGGGDEEEGECSGAEDSHGSFASLSQLGKRLSVRCEVGERFVVGEFRERNLFI